MSSLKVTEYYALHGKFKEMFIQRIKKKDILIISNYRTLLLLVEQCFLMGQQLRPYRDLIKTRNLGTFPLGLTCVFQQINTLMMIQPHRAWRPGVFTNR